MSGVHHLRDLTLIATKTTRATASTEWVDWLAPHVDELGGALWALLDPARPGLPGAGHSHVLHLPTGQVEEHEREVSSRDGAGAYHAEIQRDRWTRAGDGIGPAPEFLDAEVFGLIAAHVLSIDPARTDEWDDWYETQHLPDMMASNAFVSGTRWRRTVPRPGGANHLTIYEVAGIDVTEAISRSAAIMPDLIARGRKHECHAGGLTWALQRVR